MNKGNVAFLTQSFLALCLAIQVWVWFIYIGVFWSSDSLVSLGDLVHSVGPLKAGWKAVLAMLVPTLLVSFFVRERLSTGLRTGLYTLLGGLCGVLYLLYLAGQSFGFFLQQAQLYLAAGALAGLLYGLIMGMSLKVPGDQVGQSVRRRNLLGSLGVLTGGAGLVGSLFGPWQLWKNRDSYIDVDVGQLQEGEQITVVLARKPVWIIRRSAQTIRLLEEENPRLADARSEYSQQPEQARNALRSVRPEYFIVYGICTHLGCIPDYRPDDSATPEPFARPGPQFFCPCHGGVFDLAGRVYENMPPPSNLVVPEYEFISDQVVRLHFPTLAQEWRL